MTGLPSQWLGEALVSSHPYLGDECAAVGSETISAIQGFLACLPQPASMRITPGFRPAEIHGESRV